jgi:hypothetical protein
VLYPRSLLRVASRLALTSSSVDWTCDLKSFRSLLVERPSCV